MEGQITWKKEIRKDTLLLILKLNNGVNAKVYVVKGFRNEINWSSFKVGEKVGGLIWFNEAQKIIDADSPIHPLN